MNLIVRSGNATQWLQNALNRRNQQNAGDEQMAGSMANAQREFKDFLSDFNTMDANNEIVVDLAQNLDSVEAKDGDAQSFASGVSTLSKEAQTSRNIPWTSSSAGKQELQCR